MSRAQLLSNAKDKVQARYWADPEFRERLRGNTTAVLADEVGWKFHDGLRWSLVEADPHALYIVTQAGRKPELTIPFDVPDDVSEKIQSIPPDTLEQVLPEGVGVVKLQNNENLRHLVLAKQPPDDPDELSDDDIDAVAGGTGKGPSTLDKGLIVGGMTAGVGAGYLANHIGTKSAVKEANLWSKVRNAPKGTVERVAGEHGIEPEKGMSYDHPDHELNPSHDENALRRHVESERSDFSDPEHGSEGGHQGSEGHGEGREVGHGNEAEHSHESEHGHGEKSETEHSEKGDSHGSEHEKSESEHEHSKSEGKESEHSGDKSSESDSNVESDADSGGESTGDEILSGAEDVAEDAGEFFADMCCCCP